MGKGKDSGRNDDRGSDNTNKIKGTNGDDILAGTPRNDIIEGRKGDDVISGGAGNDILYGDNGKSGGWDSHWDKYCWWKPRTSYDDLLDGGAGNDKIYAGRGDDVAVYNMQVNLGARDYYDGGSGDDTLHLQLTVGEYRLASVQQDLATFQAFLDRRGHFHCDDDKLFQFRSFDLDVRNFEALAIQIINNAPAAGADSFATDEDHALVVAAPGLLANDTDPDHLDVLRVVGANATSAYGASIITAPGGSFTYDPAAAAALQALAVGESATDSFSYTIADLGGLTASATVKVAVAGVNDAPVTQDDANATDEDHAVAGNVLGNDHDVDHGDVVHVAAVNGSAANVGVPVALASGALVTLNADGSYLYDPNGAFESLGVGFSASDGFAYSIADSHGAAGGPASVAIAIAGVNDAPIARDDTAVTDEDTPIVVDVLANDTDVDAGDTLTASPTLFDPRDAYQYLAEGESAVATFDYTVTDNHGASDTAQVTVLVTGVNDAPVAEDDSVVRTAPLVESLFGFDGADPADLGGGFSLPFFIVYPFGYGVGGSPMAYAYTGNDAVDGADGAIQRPDGQDFALVSLDVAAFFTPHAVTIAGYDDGVQVASLTVDLDVAGPSNGAAGYVGLVFGADWESIDQVRFYADFNGDHTFIDNLRVAVAGEGNEDTPADIDVLANDHDPDTSDVLHVASFDPTSAMGASISLNADGTLHYDAAAASAVQALAVGETATDTFAYTAGDGHGGFDDALVSVQLTGVNDLPVAADDAAATDEDAFVDIGVTGNDTDPDASDVLHVGSFDAASAMGASISLNSDGTLRYDGSTAGEVQGLGIGESATDTFSYTVSDGHGGTDTATVSVELTGANDAPVAVDDSNLLIDLRGFEGGSAPGYSLPGFNFYPFGLGVGGSAMAYAYTGNNSVADGADGSLQRSDGANFTLLSLDIGAYFTPHPVTLAGYDDGVLVASLTVPLNAVGPSSGFAGYTSVGFDSSWASIDEVLFYADDVGDYTFIDNLRAAMGSAGSEDAPLRLAVLANDVDPDVNDFLEVSAFDAESALGAEIGINADGSLHYDPRGSATLQALAAGETAIDTLTYTVSDGNGGSDSATVTVFISGRNDAPEAADDAYALDEDGVLVVAAAGVLDNDSDIDGDALSAAVVEEPEHGTLVLNPDGSFTYTPHVDYNGTDSFTYAAGDGDLEGSATVMLTIAALNDAPLAADDAYNVPSTGALTVAAGPGVLGNDTDVEGDALLASVQSGPAHGVLVFNPDGSFTYTAEDGFAGQDSFTYLANDGQADSAAATVRLTITDENSPPDAVNDTASTNEDATVSGNVLSAANGGRDTDPDGDALTVTTTGTFGTALGGSVALAANGSFTYDPRGSATLQALNAGQSKVDSFAYSISDGHGGSDSAVVSVTVAGRAEAQGGGGNIDESIAPGSELDYYIRFDSSEFTQDWLRLGSFDVEIINTLSTSGSAAASKGKLTAEDLKAALGSGATVVKLTEALTHGDVIKAVEIAVAQRDEQTGEREVIDAYRFTNAQVTQLKTQGDGQDTANDLAFDFTAFAHKHMPSGALVDWSGISGKSGGAGGIHVPNADQMDESELGDGLPTEADLQYYARFEGTGIDGSWLKLDSFAMGLSSPAAGAAGSARTIGRATAEDPVLVLGSSQQVVELTKAMVDGTALKTVEVEAYGLDPQTGQLRLVDEFRFDGARITGMHNADAATNEVSLGITKFSHGHLEFDPIFGSQGGSSLTSFDFIKGAEISAPSPHGDAKGGGGGNIDESIAPGSELDYYIRFDSSEFTQDWLRLGSFDVEIINTLSTSGSAAASKGKLTAEDLKAALGSGATVVKLTEALTHGDVIKAVEIAVAQRDEQTGEREVIDAYRFTNAQVTQLKTQGDGQDTANDLAFDFTAFAHKHMPSGALVDWSGISGKSGGAGSIHVPNADQMDESELGDGLPTEANLQYYARFEGTGIDGSWLKLDSFAMGLSSPAAGAAGSARTIGRATAEDPVLVLGSSQQVVELTKAMVDGTALKTVEVEAYGLDPQTGQLRLVDEFRFDGARITGMHNADAATNEVSLGITKFSHGHLEFDPIFGSQGGSSLTSFDFIKGAEISAPSPHGDAKGGGGGNIDESIAPGSELDYYIRFDSSEFTQDWLRLGSFDVEIINTLSTSGSAAASKGKLTAEDLKAALGSGATVVKLTEALTHGDVIKAVEIAVAQRDEQTGEREVIDAYRFTNAQVTQLKTQGDGQDTANDLAFDFTAFAHKHMPSGALVDWSGISGKSGGAGSIHVPNADQMDESELGDGLPTEANLQYYARFEGTGIDGSWLKLDSFAMGLSSPAAGAAGSARTIGRATAEDPVLVLGSSQQVVELTKAMVDGTALKTVEVEAYGLDPQTGQLRLVDEFRFDGARITGMHNADAATNEVSLGITKFSHGHLEFDPIFGSQGGSSLTGFDFTKGAEISAPSPHGDVDFF